MKVYIKGKIIENENENGIYSNVSKCILENKRLKVVYENGVIEYYSNVKKENITVEGGFLIDNSSNSSLEERVAELENIVTQLMLVNGGVK